MQMVVALLFRHKRRKSRVKMCEREVSRARARRFSSVDSERFAAKISSLGAATLAEPRETA